jgi:hypothetical protein
MHQINYVIIINGCEYLLYIDKYWISHDNFGIDVIILHNSV